MSGSSGTGTPLSGSTRQSLLDTAIANRQYKTNDSVAEAQAYRDAVEGLILLTAEETRSGGDSVRMNMKIWENRLQAVNDWLAANSDEATTKFDGSVRYTDFQHYRD